MADSVSFYVSKTDRSTGTFRLFLYTLAGLVMAFVVAFGQPAAAQSYRFTSVEIEGNQRVDAATILSYAGIARGQTVSAADVNEAYQNIVNSGLFEEVLIEPRGSTLFIQVVEYPTVNVISFEGNRLLDDDVLRAVVQTQSRRVYSPSQAEADAASIVVAYEQGGRLAATVDPKIIRRSDNRVDVVFEITEGRVIEVERISFVGNRNYSDRRLRRVVTSKQAGLLRRIISADTFVADRIEFDRQVLRDFYASRGYVDFQILSVSSELTRQRDGFLVTFNLQEGQQFRVGEVTVISDLPQIDTDYYLSQSNLRQGRIYSPTNVEANIARLERLATQQGLDFIRVEPRITRNDRTLELDVEFNVVRGDRVFVERIDIEGNATTLDRVIRRQFDTVEGDPFNPREIRAAADRIRALGFFANTDVTASEGSTPDQVIVGVDVEEQATGTLSFGASYSTTDDLGLTAGITEANFLGRGQAVSFNLATGVDNAQASFSFFEPSFLARDVGLRLRFTYDQTTDRNSNLFDTGQLLFSPSLEFPLSDFSRMTLRYTLEQIDLDNYTGTSVILASEAARGAEIASKIGYSVSFDTRNTGLNPDAGVLFRFNQDLAGLGGDAEYLETTALVAAETLLFGRDIQLRAEFEGGLIQRISGNSRITDRYFLNGSLRGFDFNGIGPRDFASSNGEALGGNNFAVARLEAEFPIGLPDEYGIRGGVFADLGSVWGLDDTIGGLVDDDFALRGVLGFSIFWETALGPLRFNFTDAFLKESFDEERNFDLTISTRF